MKKVIQYNPSNVAMFFITLIPIFVCWNIWVYKEATFDLFIFAIISLYYILILLNGFVYSFSIILKEKRNKLIRNNLYNGQYDKKIEFLNNRKLRSILFKSWLVFFIMLSMAELFEILI